LGVKIKVVLVENLATSTFKVIPQCGSMAFSNKRAWSGHVAKMTAWKKISHDRFSKVSLQSE
jgi:uncharacterized C2H2 Zn-finger protein